MKTVAVILAVSSSAIGAAQVRVRVPDQHYKSHDKIDVQITNTGASNVTFCVEAGYISYIDSEHSESSPTPIYVQQRGARGWSSLLTGPDIGSARSPETLGPGQSQHFPFRVNASGTIRLVLNYWPDSNQHSCENRNGLRVARSREISME